MVITETARLRLRHLDSGDLDAMVAVYGDPAVARWAGDRQPLARPVCEHWIAVTQRNYQRRGYGMFALCLVGGAANAAIGFCGLVHPGDQPEAEIKYALRQDQWGRGLATEAAAALLQWGASQRGLTRVIATTDPDNAASHRVLLKAGMQRGALRLNDDGSHTQLFEWTAARDSAAAVGEAGA